MTAGADAFRPAAVLAAIERATGQLLASAAELTDAQMRAGSLLPGWTRGHVMTHVARNADGGARLLRWARTGVEGYEYPSMQARAAEIEAGAGRPAARLVADVRDSAARFADEYRLMPAEAWTRTVRWTSGRERPAARAADSRLTEVLVHHVDLDAGFGPADWPPGFVRDMLGRVVAAFGAREAGAVPAMELTAVDTGARYTLGGPHEGAGARVRGPQHALLAWLMGRPPGTAELAVAGGGPLPEPPFLY